jgi:hypothetical protein
MAAAAVKVSSSSSSSSSFFPLILRSRPNLSRATLFGETCGREWGSHDKLPAPKWLSLNLRGVSLSRADLFWPFRLQCCFQKNSWTLQQQTRCRQTLRQTFRRQCLLLFAGLCSSNRGQKCTGRREKERKKERKKAMQWAKGRKLGEIPLRKPGQKKTGRHSGPFPLCFTCLNLIDSHNQG